MALVRWEPARELNTLQQEMNRLFNTFFDAPQTGGSGGGTRRWVPPMDLVETDGHFVLRADLPGLSEGDVDIEVQENVLTLSGERRFEHDVKKDGFYRLERGAGQFSRSLTLPEGVDADAIAASFDKGVLEVRIPKPEQRKPRRVEISVGAGSGTAADKPAIEGSAEANGAPVAA
jgi:HSP20 family protein